MFAEILPNVMAPILVEATIRLGYAIFAVATLSVPRVRAAAAVARLGAADRRQLQALIAFDWWTVLFPALAIASLVVGVNLVADGLQQVLER